MGPGDVLDRRFVIEALAGSGGAATVAFKVNAAGDVFSPIAVGTLALNYLTNNSNMSLASVHSPLTMTVGTAPLTGGKAVIILQWAQTGS